MDGTNAKKLITTDLDIPNGIAVDFQGTAADDMGFKVAVYLWHIGTTVS